jgi:cytochrome P450
VTHPDPYPYYANLVASRPFGYDERLRLWVAADAAHVTAVLADPGLKVRPPAEPVPPGIVGTAAGQVFGDLVRMTDGAAPQRLKNIVVAALSQVDPDRVASLAASRAAYLLDESRARGDTSQAVPSTRPSSPLRELMFSVPAQVVAAACGLDGPQATRASRLIGDFVQCLPASATAAQQAAAARAAAALRELFGPALTDAAGGLLGDLVRAATRADWTERAPLLANGIGLLSQTYDATAGLIGNTLLAIGRGDIPALTSAAQLTRYVREVARHDGPVHNTRRFAAGPVRIGSSEVAAGDAILVVLAAANRDPAVNPGPDVFRPDRVSPALFTFGAAAHYCPGETIAVAIASAVTAELVKHGLTPASVPSSVAYQPLANVRIPVL